MAISLLALATAVLGTPCSIQGQGRHTFMLSCLFTTCVRSLAFSVAVGINKSIRQCNDQEHPSSSGRP